MDSEMPTLEQEVEIARARFVAWLEWFMRMYPEKAPTKTALAKQLGFSSHAAVVQLLDPHKKRAPDFRTLIAAKLLLRVGFETMLGTDPPILPDLPKK